MFFKSSVHLIIYSLVLFIITKSIDSNKHFLQRSKRAASNYEPKCREQSTPVDQVINYDNRYNETRKKRFVLFPEFILFLNDTRYLQRPPNIFYWISNFYPDRVNSDHIRRIIENIIQQINTVVDIDITVHEASDPGEATFHFSFFDYTKCPMDGGSQATIDSVKAFQELLIYPVELVRKSRYRAHGGIEIIERDKPISVMKFNMQQTFLYSEDYVYDPVIYTCVDETNECEIDLHYVLLHETLHGFGIEHTTNAENPTPPNAHMQSVMYFSPFRFLCHDDIRAIRMVYELPIKRANAEHDDTCRRDFPMNKLQKLMHQLEKLLILLFIGILISSTMAFILTLIYLLIRYLIGRKSNKFQKQASTISTSSWVKKGMIKTKPRGYLWHDEMI